MGQLELHLLVSYINFRVSAGNVDDLYRNDHAHALWASKHVADVSLLTYKHSDFLVVLTSVGLTQARPNNLPTLPSGIQFSQFLQIIY